MAGYSTFLCDKETNMTGYAYYGACGAYINEEWHGDLQILQCSKGHGMQCDGGCYPSELCDGCEMASCSD